MQSFHVIGIQDAQFPEKDRTKVAIRFHTTAGPLALVVQADHLGSLITMLEGLEHSMQLHNPATGPMPGEKGAVRTARVDGHQVMSGEVDSVPSVLLGLQTTQLFRWFALDRTTATSLQQALVDEIPKLKTAPHSH